MNKKGQFDFELDMETLLAIAMGIAAGIISLIVQSKSGAGGFWKIMTFIGSGIAGFFISKFIFSRG